MGTAWDPSYEKILMARFEPKHIYGFIKGKVDLYLRYIDDTFLICNSMEEELKDLFSI